MATQTFATKRRPNAYFCLEGIPRLRKFWYLTLLTCRDAGVSGCAQTSSCQIRLQRWKHAEDEHSSAFFCELSFLRRPIYIYISRSICYSSTVFTSKEGRSFLSFCFFAVRPRFHVSLKFMSNSGRLQIAMRGALAKRVSSW